MEELSPLTYPDFSQIQNNKVWEYFPRGLSKTCNPQLHLYRYTGGGAKINMHGLE